MQVASQSVEIPVSRVMCVVLSVISILIGVACESGPRERDAADNPDPLGWVQTLRDPLQDLPLLSASAVSGGVEAGARQRLGEPEELGGRFGAQDGSRDTQVSATPTFGGGQRGDALRAQIDVNINTGGDARVETEQNAPGMSDLASTLELSYRGDLPARPDRRLDQFGYTLLNQTASLNRTSAPAASAHTISAGDELIIDLTTDQPRRYTPIVGTDGTIEISDIGSFSVSGLDEKSLRDFLEAEIGRVRRNFELRISIGKVAPIPVRVSGEVRQGGVIDLDPRGDLLDLLTLAGIRKSGTLRNITVARGDGTVERVDLYNYLLGLEAPPSIRLVRGDSVLVPSIGATFAVAGSVQRPGIYELLEDETLSASSAIDLAGGNTGFSVVDSVQLERTTNGARALIDIRGDGFSDSLQDGDLLLVGAVDGRLHPVVESRGALIHPGRFQYREGMTVGDLVRMSGGMEIDAYAQQAVISRLHGQRGNRNSEYDAGTQVTSREIIIVDLDKALQGNPEHDLVLSALDLLRVRRFTDLFDTPMVEIIGAVRRPGKYEQTSGLRVGDLVTLAGNLSADAHREQAELIRRERTDDETMLGIQRYRIDLASILNGTDRGPTLENGDQIVIRRLRRSEVRVDVSGLVRFPGEYILPAGSKITDLIAAAGGPLPEANIRASQFTRVSVRNQQRDRWAELAERNRQVFERVLEERVNSARTKEAASARIQLQQNEQLLSRLRDVQVTGRIVIPFSEPSFPESSYNLVLEQGDRLVIPRESHTVSVLGNVFNPVTVIHSENLTTEDLIEQAGGITEIADNERVYVVRADGRVEGVIQESGTYRLDHPLLAGDVVLVPKRALDRDFGSVMLDLLLTARTAAEATALWNLATSDIDEANLSLIAPAGSQSDPNQMNNLLDEYQNQRR